MKNIKEELFCILGGILVGTVGSWGFFSPSNATPEPTIQEYRYESKTFYLIDFHDGEKWATHSPGKDSRTFTWINCETAEVNHVNLSFGFGHHSKSALNRMLRRWIDAHQNREILDEIKKAKEVVR